MKHLTRRSLAPLTIVLALFASAAWTVPGCAPPPPNLTPQASIAFRGTQAIKTLDLLRDIAVDGNATVPPVFSESEMIAVVKWHRATITTIDAAVKTGQTGWQSTTKTGLDSVVNALSPKAKETILPYVGLAKTIIDEIP